MLKNEWQIKSEDPSSMDGFVLSDRPMQLSRLGKDRKAIRAMKKLLHVAVMRVAMEHRPIGFGPRTKRATRTDENWKVKMTTFDVIYEL